MQCVLRSLCSQGGTILSAKKKGGLPPHRQRHVQNPNRPPPADTCRGHCKRHDVAAPEPRPGDRGYWIKDGGRVYCRQCRRYMTARPVCPCDQHHQLRGGAKASRQAAARDLFEREAAARAKGPGGTRDDTIRMKTGRNQRIQKLARGFGT